jgi:acyl-CoA reductase-like NAD-dependent aldehyde dehydrogenase
MTASEHLTIEHRIAQACGTFHHAEFPAHAFDVARRVVLDWLGCVLSGTIHVNAASSSRLDAMPFGGVKDSGHGKEGPKCAIEEMTERRLAVWHDV